MIQPGDIVEATRDGGRDPQGFPLQYPRKGRIYKILSIYRAPYGLGCTLAGMSAYPYNGYLLHVQRGGLPLGWYFRKADADEEFTQWIRSIHRSKSLVR